MALINEIYESGSITIEEFKIFTKLLNPFAPHVTEEVWKNQNFGKKFVCEQTWPKYDENKCTDKEIEIAVQVNGKIRARIVVPIDANAEKVKEIAKKEKTVLDSIGSLNILKEIYVPGKLLNIVAK